MISIPKSFWMVDLETLSVNRKHHSIIQVGVCLCEGEKFTRASRVVNPFSSNKIDARMDIDTLAWWSDQKGFSKLIHQVSDASTSDARKALNSCLAEILFPDNSDCTPGQLQSSLENMSHLDWYFTPPGFDAEMLEEFPSRLPLPWKWYRIKCFRTLKDIFGDYRNQAALDMGEEDYHDAGYDAELQARALRHLFNAAEQKEN